MKHLGAQNKLMQDNGDIKAMQNDWKSREALLQAFCLMRRTTVTKNATYPCYDIVPFFKTVLADLNNPGK